MNEVQASVLHMAKNFHKWNHFAPKCRLKRQTNTRQRKNVATNRNESVEYNECLTLTLTPLQKDVQVMHCRNHYAWNYQRQVYDDMHINGKGVKLQIDTGATCNVLKRIEVSRETKIMPIAQMITLYDRSRVKPYGKCKVKVTNPRIVKTYDVEFAVI